MGLLLLSREEDGGRLKLLDDDPFAAMLSSGRIHTCQHFAALSINPAFDKFSIKLILKIEMLYIIGMLRLFGKHFDKFPTSAIPNALAKSSQIDYQKKT